MSLSKYFTKVHIEVVVIDIPMNRSSVWFREISIATKEGTQEDVNRRIWTAIILAVKAIYWGTYGSQRRRECKALGVTMTPTKIFLGVIQQFLAVIDSWPPFISRLACAKFIKNQNGARRMLVHWHHATHVNVKNVNSAVVGKLTQDYWPSIDG